MKKLILLNLILSLSYSSFADVIPIAARYDGAGGVYGAGYSHATDDYKVLIGGVTGDAQAFGGLFTKYFGPNLELSFGVVSFSDIGLTTTYNRNTKKDDDDKYILNFDGSAYAIGSKLWLLSDTITLSLSATQSTIKFDGYQDDSGDDIDLAGANLFDVETLNTKIGVDFNFFDNNRAPNSGVGFNTSMSSISGRTGQSDQMILDYGMRVIVPFLSHFSASFKTKFSDALVEVDSSYDTDAEIRATLDANCSSIANLAERAKCTKLENDLVAYILENNKNGSATPLGGSGGLRSFREQRFKAAHTALYSAEIKTNLSTLFGILKSNDSILELITFYDLGYANDDKLDLFKESKFSNGVALQFSKKGNAVRLQAASGSDDSNSWSLNFGAAI